MSELEVTTRKTYLTDQRISTEAKCAEQVRTHITSEGEQQQKLHEFPARRRFCLEFTRPGGTFHINIRMNDAWVQESGFRLLLCWSRLIRSSHVQRGFLFYRFESGHCNTCDVFWIKIIVRILDLEESKFCFGTCRLSICCSVLFSSCDSTLQNARGQYQHRFWKCFPRQLFVYGMTCFGEKLLWLC